MDTEALRKELLIVDSLVKDNIISEDDGNGMKADLIKKYKTEFMATPRKEMPNDIAHLPGRMIGGVIKALGNINAERCAGVAPEQQRGTSKKRTLPNMNDLPDIYKD